MGRKQKKKDKKEKEKQDRVIMIRQAVVDVYETDPNLIDNLQDKGNQMLDGFQNKGNQIIDGLQKEGSNLLNNFQLKTGKFTDKIVNIVKNDKIVKEKQVIHNHEYNQKKVRKAERSKTIPKVMKFVAKNLFENIMYFDTYTMNFVLDVYYLNSQGQAEKIKRKSCLGNEINHIGIQTYRDGNDEEKVDKVFITHKNYKNQLIQFTIDLNTETLEKSERIYEDDINDLGDVYDLD